MNTLDVDEGVDSLRTPADLESWLAERGLDGSADLAAALALREGLREAMRANHGPGGSSRALDQALSPMALQVSYGPAGPVLVGSGLAALAAALVQSGADGTWSRLKICPEETCQWAFLDSSKNRSRTWCSMKVCGNRTKTRAYRARQRTE